MSEAADLIPIPTVEHVFDAADASSGPAIPIWLVGDATPGRAGTDFGPTERRWLEQVRFSSAAKKQALLPALDGSIAGVALGLGSGNTGEPCGPAELLVGQLAPSLHPNVYRLAGTVAKPELAAIAWGLGAYRYRRYKSKPVEAQAQLRLPEGVSAAAVRTAVEAVWFGRDLINTPASDLGPDELERAVRTLATRHGADVSSVVGDDLLARNFPLIHAVGKASARAPRLVDLTWGRPDAPLVTLVGKGICFDTGGLDIKPSAGMLLMKKDMGGAATALALGHMIMAGKLDCRLRILIPAAENSIAGNAFRPSDIVRSRAGPTVEIGNTDAEGRLVLADALALADETPSRHLFTFATLTGAARVALGPDVPALFSDDAELAADLVASGDAVGDPMWRLPLWAGYDRGLDGDISDMNNVGDGPFAGAIVAALFLKRFVTTAKSYAHLDLYGWRPAPRPLGPKGGEPQTARAVYEVLAKLYAAKGASA